MSNILGNCHCGSVCWEFTLPIETVAKCHCRNCRKLQGSDYSTWVVVPKNHFQVTSGESLLTTYDVGVSRKTFCSRCGTAAYLVNGKQFPEHIILALGTLNDFRPELKPQIQVFTAYKAPWLNIHDDEPCLH